MIGDVLALIGWIELFEGGLIIDPRPLLRDCRTELLLELLEVCAVGSGLHRLVRVELDHRAGRLSTIWVWRVTGIMSAEILAHRRGSRNVMLQSVWAEPRRLAVGGWRRG